MLVVVVAVVVVVVAVLLTADYLCALRIRYRRSELLYADKRDGAYGTVA
jgi:hypothetical protein